jgi:beta-galactosidase
VSDHARGACDRRPAGGRAGWRGLAVGLLLIGCAAPVAAAGRLVLNFNPGWRFVKADPAGAAEPGFDDRGWAVVSLPHTFNDVDTFDDWSTPGHRGEQIQWSGRTWYRKTFRAPEGWRGRRVFIEFEGARQLAEVFLNGRRLGVSKTGFTPFGFELTPWLRGDGQPNVLAVMCDNRFMSDPVGDASSPTLAQLSARVNDLIPESLEELRADQIPWNNPHWHPAHGGLYRNVRVIVTSPVHVSLPLYSFLQTAGPYVYATGISSAAAEVHVEVPVENATQLPVAARVEARVSDASGRAMLSVAGSVQLAAGGRAAASLHGTVTQPRLWEPAYPHLYRVVCTVRVGAAVVDSVDVSFGIRAIRWDTARGLTLNGHPLALHGWGQKPTDEWPGLGAALPDWLHDYTLRLMKEAGGNFVRWGHAAAGSAQIASSDRLGLIVDQPGVDGESDTRGAAWALRASAFRDVLVYFRNAPSIFIWEGGNQKVSRGHAHELRGLMDTWDPHGGRAYAHRRADATTAEVMDLQIGTEGGRESTSLPVVEGEYDREESPRRVWDSASPPSFGYPEAKGQTYQLTSEQFAVNQVAHYVTKLLVPGHSGGANWIFSDSTSGGRVSVEVARASGEVDGVRLPKEAYYVCAAMFLGEPRVQIVGHWSYPAGTVKPVYVVAAADEVELFVNGTSLGRRTPADRFVFTFPSVAWQAGAIRAVAYRAGTVVASQVKQTAGPAVRLRMSPLTAPGGLRADGSDVALFDVEAVDAAGRRVPTAQARVDFVLTGPAVWRGGYNSGKVDSISHPYLDLEAGVARVSVRSGRVAGRVVLHAVSPGLASAEAVVVSSALDVTNGFSAVAPATGQVTLPAVVPAWHFGVVPEGAPSSATSAVEMVGRHIRSLSYSGPAVSRVHVETAAREGALVYVDADIRFGGLPAFLVGADWIQAAERDSLYGAVDLMEVAVAGGRAVWVAHDDRLARPAWLIRGFRATGATLSVGGQPMSVFERRVESDASLTLGANSESTAPTPARMYVVFVGAVGVRHQ